MASCRWPLPLPLLANARLSSARARLVVLALLIWAGGLTSIARADATITKGPYLMDASPTRIAVLFELSEAAPATVRLTRAGEEVSTVELPASDFHEALFEGLEPGAGYEYTVVTGVAEESGSFNTAPPPGEGPIRFLVMGDNRTDAEAHAAVIAAMQNHEAELVLNTGDMVANGALDSDWQELFDVEGPLLRNTPLFPAMGNHELYLRGVGLPSYLRYTRVPDELSDAETYYGFDWGPVRFLMLDSNDAWEDPELPQRRWLEQQLDAAKSAEHVAHVIVAMHHGPVSSNRHGSHQGMVDSGVLQLLRLSGVALVLSGHDHAYERGDAHGVKYIVTGGGGAPLYNRNDPLPFQHRFEASHHFLVIEASRERVEVFVRRVDDSILEHCAFDRGGRWECVRDEEFVASEPVDVPTTDVGGEDVPDGAEESPPPFGLIFLGVVAVGLLAWFWIRRRLS
jgi:hypothetical protein